MDNEHEWSLTGFLDELKRIHQTMPDRRFVFILGAGASIESNVKGASPLAKEWMKIIFRRSNNGNEDEYSNWLRNNPLNIEGWDANNLAAHYPQIFSFCFNGDHESGYAELEKAIDQGSPSFGYAVLAWVLAQDRHNMVVTTNFDNLVADSMYIYGGKTPLVIGHESLASYLKPMSRRPMIAKIHRDLFTDPINDEDGVGELKSDWIEALRNIFRFYTPVFIGYGGNDGSLMNFLKSLKTNDISGRPFWCYYEKGEKPNGDIAELMEEHKGVLIQTPGFDQLMFKIGTAFGYERHSQRRLVQEHTEQMLNTLNAKIEEVYKESPKDTQEKLRKPAPGNDKDWLDWVLEASHLDSYEKKIEHYEKATKELPDSWELYNNLGSLYLNKNNFEKAELAFKSSLQLNPNNPRALMNISILYRKTGELEKSVQHSERAIELEPKNSEFLTQHATNHSNAGNHTIANNYYLQSISIDPNNSQTNNNYAYSLISQGDFDSAETHIQKALEIAPNNHYNIETYAELLLMTNRLEQAKIQIERALAIEPNSDTGLKLQHQIKQARKK